ncbi:23S rRNA (adenine(2503)-C(2))-methyltransferase RlmN, partial [Patescibacteria group bacterium]|nr:23S rRNA (adenine(2503)-C(2))-methyltransferase RlmN [Patescibacteria group bacterium]
PSAKRRRDCFVVPLRGTPRNDIINKINNVVFMGMGEPFLNYDNVLAAIKILNDKEGFNLGARHFSISTVGITEGIEKLAQEKMEVNLAISLHAPNDKLRSSIMPINKKYPLGKILRAVDEYIKQTRRRVMFEYIMIEEINDSDDCARQLADLLKNTLGFVNLITYNPTGIFKPSSSQRLNKFKEILEKAGVAVTQRYRFGDDIKGACGQLAGNANNN